VGRRRRRHPGHVGRREDLATPRRRRSHRDLVRFPRRVDRMGGRGRPPVANHERRRDLDPGQRAGWVVAHEHAVPHSDDRLRHRDAEHRLWDRPFGCALPVDRRRDDVEPRATGAELHVLRRRAHRLCGRGPCAAEDDRRWRHVEPRAHPARPGGPVPHHARVPHAGHGVVLRQGR
jgi:hypothetical protein